MFRLNLPQYEIKIGEKDGKRRIFDFLRRKYVALTPEEWVRQHFTHFLVEHKGYPKGLLGNEVELHVGEKRLRCDTVLHNQQGQPLRPDISLQSSAACGLSHREQRASALLLQDGLR